MLPVYDVDADAYRAKVKSFLAEKLPSGFTGIGSLEGDEITEFVSEWRQTLFESGYLAPGWPQKYGGAGLSALEQVISSARITCSRADSPAPPYFCGQPGAR